MSALLATRAQPSDTFPAPPPTEAISRLSIPNEAAQPPEITALFERFRSHYGFVPNWLLALSVNPGTVIRMVAFYEHLFDPSSSQLQARDRELIAVVSSATNGCSYCVFNHTASLSQALNDPVKAQRIARDHHEVPLNAREKVLADVSQKLSRDARSVAPDDFQALAAQGFNEAAVLEIFEISAFFAYCNRLSTALQVTPDNAFFEQAAP
ncbi:peroxidase-related enzyme [Pseudomonas typographi]|uniref:Peroxidase-related enzyme n=1 Tax=Pseudomonas typographi TaxID=2715964 RepID=A0ABR7YWS5_9PSED|nr:peroxidase-related enzyme [Pseudomonas typographi]MBD1552591.1 peroxidase-related enzyme [Pseudomonas typographi]MBD1586172.1 peroxidase-related enzyme [Pseudomonas typographi]MBD1597643.1 peroxidase-related enzyme [Pseudomonas typographi]